MLRSPEVNLHKTRCTFDVYVYQMILSIKYEFTLIFLLTDICEVLLFGIDKSKCCHINVRFLILDIFMTAQNFPICSDCYNICCKYSLMLEYQVRKVKQETIRQIVSNWKTLSQCPKYITFYFWFPFCNNHLNYLLKMTIRLEKQFGYYKKDQF